MAEVDCTCSDWKETLPKLNAPIQLQSARSGFKWQYDGTPFRFCPWCGEELKEKRRDPGPSDCDTCGGTRSVRISQSAGGGRIGHWEGNGPCPDCTPCGIPIEHLRQDDEPSTRSGAKEADHAT